MEKLGDGRHLNIFSLIFLDTGFFGLIQLNKITTWGFTAQCIELITLKDLMSRTVWVFIAWTVVYNNKLSNLVTKQNNST